MAIIVEDGSIVPGANSYVTVAEVRTYAENRGATLPSEDDALSPMLFAAMDYLQSFRSRYKGVLVSPGVQPLAWPRAKAYIDGALFPSDAIPRELKDAQCQCVIEVANGYDLLPSADSYATKREKVDVIEVEYAVGGSNGGGTAVAPMSPTFPKVDALLDPLLRSSGLYLRAARS